ncbi:hypothetical protein Dsin_032704 [Dipteronia sinensis]|uniref:Glycosyl hydrolase family 32 C-terminal domain-containing protein n=1 Tax=Dipteronia sinensis TaxID=43782 RepID=A0AAE0DI68_9ROSI|nr:hypothetical protein Dsin_032704 [Dipteronia sinensis]
MTKNETGNTTEPITMDIYIDGSLIEIFINERYVLSSRSYPSLANSTGIGFDVDEVYSVTVSNINVWQSMSNVWPDRPLNASSPLEYDEYYETHVTFPNPYVAEAMYASVILLATMYKQLEFCTIRHSPNTLGTQQYCVPRGGFPPFLTSQYQTYAVISLSDNHEPGAFVVRTSTAASPHGKQHVTRSLVLGHFQPFATAGTLRVCGRVSATFTLQSCLHAQQWTDIPSQTSIVVSGRPYLLFQPQRARSVLPYQYQLRSRPSRQYRMLSSQQLLHRGAGGLIAIL